MTEALLVGAAAIMVAAPAGALMIRGGRDRLLRSRLRETVVVTLKSKASFRGVLFEVDDRTVVLRDAEALDPSDGARIKVDGEMVLARGDVEYMQRPWGVT